MNQKDDAFFRKLRLTFKIEAEEHLKVIAAHLLESEKSPAQESLEIIFREVHSLKGAARSVNAGEIESVCQSMESVLAGLKRRELISSPELYDLFHQAVNDLQMLLSSFESERAPNDKSRIEALIRRLENVLMGPSSPPRKEASAKPQNSQPLVEEARLPKETVRISTTMLDAILFQVEELISEKMAAVQHVRDLHEVNSMVSRRNKEWAKIFPGVRAIQRTLEKEAKGKGYGKRDFQVLKLIEYLESSASFDKLLQTRLVSVRRSNEQDCRSLALKVDGLLDDAKHLLMLPFASLLEIFPKLVRDLSRDRKKEVEWITKGEEIEMDRRILEEIKDPLIHLVRNAIDHGIEFPDEREKKQKPGEGKIQIIVSRKDAGKMEIVISDDGAGIDAGKVRSAALKSGAISEKSLKRLSDKEVLPLVFMSGVSTSPIITDLSGRGLGLAIVREKVEKLGGLVSIETQVNIGTTFRIVLPMTLVTFRGILVQADDRFFILPAIYVGRVVRVSPKSIKTVENRETIEIDGQPVSLVRLGDVLGLPHKNKDNTAGKSLPVAVLNSGDRQIGFQVDEILYEREVLVKGLGPQLVRVRNIAGATVLDRGNVVPILNIPDLFKSAIKGVPAPDRTVVARVQEPLPKRKTILVAEDSITSRTLLKNILESSGYSVRTAVDGMEAFTTLKTEEFDIIVSDVDMPRMNGFELTAKIRADNKLSELPVMLLTALESREDRERGIDAGANAYIVKNSFDQSNLLETISRLI